MNCPEVRERLYDHLYRLLEDREARALEDHVALCGECRAERAQLAERDKLLDAWRPLYVPARALRMPVRRAAPIRWLWAAALLMGVALGWLIMPARSPYHIARGQAVNPDTGAALPPDQPMTAGLRLETRGGASLRLGAAGAIELEPGTRIHIRKAGPDQDHEIELEQGSLYASVHAAGKAFRVLAVGTAVEVTGTAFTVRRFTDDEIAHLLGEPDMKRRTLAAASVALVSVSAGTVLVTGPSEKRTVRPGESALSTPSRIEIIRGRADSLQALASYRKQLADVLAADDRDAARTEYGRALEVAAQLEMAPLAEQCRQASARLAGA